MRSRSISPALRQNLYQEPETETHAGPEMQLGQVVALLKVRKGGDDSLFGKVLEKLGSSDSGQMDRAALIAAGYIQYDARLRDFVLLPRGLFKAQALARELAKSLGVHHITYSAAAPRSNRGPTVACSCGWNTFASKRNANMLRVHASRHLDKVAAGTFKPMSDVVDKIVSQLSDSGSPNTRPPSFAASLSNPGADVGCVSATAPGSSFQQSTMENIRD
jgi:hypothetical protein